MRNRVFWLSIVLAAVSVAVIGLSSQPRTAEALAGDVCSIVTWDSTGRLLNDGDVVGGNGAIYLLFRVEDDSFGFLQDFLSSDEVQALLQILQDEIDALNLELADLVSSADWIAFSLPAYDENTTSFEILEDIEDIEDEPGFNDPVDPNYEDLHDQYNLLNQAYQIVLSKESLEEVLREIIEILEGLIDLDLVQIDSQTGSARIRSYAEVGGFEWVKPNVWHNIIPAPGTGSQWVDHIFPDFFNDSDGHDLDDIKAWLEQVTGVPAPVSSAADVCGDDASDGWGFVDLQCQVPGSFNVNVIPHRPARRSELTTGVRHLICPGQAETAEIAASPSTLETQPVGSSSDESLITVTAYDAAGDNLDGAEVQFITNNCTFTNPNAGKAGDFGISPAALGPVVTVWSDTDSTADLNFLTNNPLQTYAGTAEVTLDCSKGAPGSAVVTAIIERPGADITLQVTITVVGPTASSGLELVLNPTALVCGDILLATATAVDVNGVPVSDGTVIHFTTDTSSGIVGGQEGGQGANQTIDGETTVTVAVSPDDPGTHSVIAWTVDSNGALHAETSQLFECSKAGDAVQGVQAAAPANQITPPSTGDAGLAASASGHPMLNLFLVIGAGLATCYLLLVTRLYGRRR